MEKAAALGDIFITTTGDIRVITEKHFRRMKDGAILANAGHFNVEIDVNWLENHGEDIVRREGIATYHIDGRSIHLLAEGRLVNLATPKGMGHPIEVMDLSFSLQALSTQYIAETGKELPPGVHEVPEQIDERVARMKLSALGLSIDELSPVQQDYLKAWDVGT
ncbi:MAG: adenosylhomocysteinase, partial [Methanomicrobiales archaeon]|nr:adenosylhomocysteinase [Methanomicrobiales archaeon]